MAYSSEVLADSPLAYWKFDEASGTTITDSSGNGRTGTYTATAVLGEPGLYTGDVAAARASSGMLGSVADGTWMNPVSGLTVEGWVKANNAGDVAALFSRYVSGAGSWIVWQRRGRIGFLLWDGSTQHEIDGPALVSGRTYHVAATVSTTAMVLYVNGRQVARKAITVSLATLQANRNPVQFGAYASANFSLATLSDVALYGSVLSAARILAHYKEVGAKRVDAYTDEVCADSPAAFWALDDTSGTSADIVAASTIYASVGTYVGGPTLGSTSLLLDGTGTAVTFDGTNDHVDITGDLIANSIALQGTGQYTAEAIIKTSTSTAGTFLNRTSFSGVNRFQLSVESGAIVGRNISTSVTITSPLSTYADGNAHHVALVQDATHLRLYVDGSEVVSSASVNTSGSDGQITYIGRGRYAGWEGYFTGTIDEVAVYPAALSSARIAAHYAAGFAAPIPSGSGDGDWGWSGSGAGSTDYSGNGTGTWGWSGSGSGTAPNVVPTGSGVGEWGWTGSGSGSGDLSGSGTGAWGWAGSGTGSAGLPSTVPSGSGVGTWGWAGSGIGVTMRPEHDFAPFRAAARIGYLTIPTAQPPPAGIDPVPVARYSHVAPAPTEANPIIREGHDYDWVNPVEVGTVHVFVGGVDVTYLWGAPVQMVEWSSTSPLGDAVASFEIPSMQAWEKPGAGRFTALYPDAPVQVVLVHTDDTRTNLWHGYLSADAATFGQRKRHGFSAEGLLWQAGHALHEPPHYMPPTDIGVMVPRILNAVPNKRWSAIPEVTTGLYTQNRGSGNQYADQITTEILARDGWTVDQQQWTLQEIAPGELRMVLKPPMDDYDCTITYGIRNYDVQLSREQASRFDVIKAKGVTNAGGQWRGTRFPGLVLATPPPYPINSAASMHVGDTDADTDSGTGISDFQRRLVELGYSLRVDGVYNSSDADVIRRLQSRMGLLVDGVVGPQTWSGIFNRGPADIDLTQWREPIAALPWTQKYLRDPNGVILGVNPEHDDSRVVHEVEIDAGTNITWTQFQPIAEKILAVESVPALTGTITLTADPHEMWRGEVKVGTRIRVLGFQGEDVIVRVGAVDARIDQERGLVMTLTVDERARDAMSIDQILSRERARLSDPARKPGNPARDSRITRDRYVQWDIDSPCGFFPRTAVFGGLWIAPNPIPFSEVGRFVKFVCTSTVPFALMLFGLPVKPSQVNAIVGDPLATTDPYRPHTEALSRLGWIEAWGEQGQRMGYWPGDEGSEYAFSGKTELIGSVDYVSGYGVWVWPLIYSATTGFVGGGSGDWISRFYPATDT